MVQVVKGLAQKASQIASTSASVVRKFPPKEAIFSPSSHTNFSPETWANLQRAPEAAVTAFVHRIGLSKVFTNTDEVRQACTHSSYPPFYAMHYPKAPPIRSNANLATLGNSLLGLFASEHVHATYPHLPTRALKAAVSAYVGPLTCSNIAREIGVPPLLRWNRPEMDLSLPPSYNLTDALASVLRALTGLVYQNRSLPTARNFVHSYFLSRDFDLRTLLKFRDPKMALSRTVSKFNRERPVSRLLKETGRRTNSPIFVVGIYSGADKLGEGFGSSLKMAEFRAAEDALHRLYLTKVPSELLSLPTYTFPEGRGSVFSLRARRDAEYTPGEIGEVEVTYGSNDG